MLASVGRLPVYLRQPYSGVVVPLSASNNVVDTPGVGVAVQARQEVFLSNAAVYGGAGAGSGKGLVVGHSIFLDYFSPVVYCRLRNDTVGCGFGVW